MEERNMRFFEYLKKQEPSKENEEARKRIYKLKKEKVPWRLNLSEEN